MKCSFCGGNCGDYACNTLDEIAILNGTTHDELSNVIFRYSDKNNTGYLSLAAINKISLTLMNEFIEESKIKNE